MLEVDMARKRISLTMKKNTGDAPPPPRTEKRDPAARNAMPPPRRENKPAPMDGAFGAAFAEALKRKST